MVNSAVRKDFLKVFINSMIGGAKNTIMIAAALSGPDQDKPWVGVLRELSRVGYFN